MLRSISMAIEHGELNRELNNNRMGIHLFPQLQIVL